MLKAPPYRSKVKFISSPIQTLLSVPDLHWVHRYTRVTDFNTTWRCHRRSGISPCPEEMYSVNTFRLQQIFAGYNPKLQKNRSFYVINNH